MVAPHVLDPDALRQAVGRRQRDQQLVLVLHPDAVLDDVAFEAANMGVTVRRNTLVGAVHRVVVFDLAELTESFRSGLDLGSGRPGPR
jgi:hypothetical protein